MHNTKDNIANPRFPDKITFYPARNGSVLPYSSISVERIYLESHYYLDMEKDWACCKLSQSIGNQIGWLGKISNFYEKNHSMMTFGYPADKGKYMYKVTGKMTDFESNGWYYRTDLDIVGGQSGSPLQVTFNNNDYIAGIATHTTDTYTGACRIDGFMFAFMNSFVTSDELPEYLSLYVNSKSGNTWNIRILNTNKIDVMAFYNSKMCNYGDAENWTNLADVKSIAIPSQSSVYVNISENWFATSIAVSIMHGTKRLVSFADNLNINSKSLSQHQNLVL